MDCFMVKVNLDARAEAQLAAQAKAKGLPLDRYLQSVLEQMAGSANLLPIEEREGAFDDWTESLSVAKGVREEAFHRENWY
jgi:hypothetical protein